jgi:hypothetical protein
MLFLCLRLAAVPSSRPADAQGRRAQGPSRLAVALGLPLAAASLPSHALTGLSTARGRLGRRLIDPDAFEGSDNGRFAPGSARPLGAGRRAGQVAKTTAELRAQVAASGKSAARPAPQDHGRATRAGCSVWQEHG